MYLYLLFILLSIFNFAKIKGQNENILETLDTPNCFSIDYYNINDKNCNLDIFWNLKGYCSDSCVKLSPEINNFITGITKMDYSMIIHCNGSVDFYKGLFCENIINTFEVALPYCFPNKQNQNPLMINLLNCDDKTDIFDNNLDMSHLIALFVFSLIIIYMVYIYFGLFFKKKKYYLIFKKFFLKKLNTN